jgi:hypothetical protein
MAMLGLWLGLQQLLLILGDFLGIVVGVIFDAYPLIAAAVFIAALGLIIWVIYRLNTILKRSRRHGKAFKPAQVARP